MRWPPVLLAVAAVALVPSVAAAHPLGNLSINRYSEIELSGKDVYVHYAVDFAEVPAFQHGDLVLKPGRFAADLAKGLVLRIDGRRAGLNVVKTRVQKRPGTGGLPTLLFEAAYEADRTGSSLTYEDMNFRAWVGWREVVVSASRGARIERSSAAPTSISRRLRAYPPGSLYAPLNVSFTKAEYQPGSEPGVLTQLGGPPAVREAGGFESLVSQELTPGFVLVSLALALFWGAAHALSPGHGKAIVAGYLVGSRGAPRHAVLLGAVVTVTHTIGVFALGVTTLALSEVIVPARLYPWLNLVAALLVLGVGAGLLRSRLESYVHARAHARGMRHDHGHDHHHHHHGSGPGIGWRSLIGVGVSGGIVPCPTALVVLLAAISLNRVGYGLVLIVAFSVGLAASITAIGLLAVTARGAFARMGFDGRLIRVLPTVSAVVVLALGVLMTARAVPVLT